MKFKKESNNRKNFNVYIPIVLIQIYLLGTIILYTYGPLEWNTYNKCNFYVLIFSYQLSLLMGYISGIKIKNTRKIEYKNGHNIEKYLTLALILNIILTTLMTIRLSGMMNLSLQGLLDKFMMGIMQPEIQYSSKFTTVSYGGKLLTYSSVILSPITWSSISLGIYYFRKINKKIDILVILSVSIEVMHWVIRGTNKGLFDLIIIVITILMLKSIRRSKNKKKVSITSKLFLIISIVLVLSYFTKNISGRIVNNWNIISYINGGVDINVNQGISKILPSSIHPLLIILTSYLTQGYYAMSMAISLPFTSTFGVGNSIFLMENIKQLIGIDFFKNTYQSKLESYGWDATVNWHTFYMWIANDLHFVGVVFIMFILGYIFATLIKEFILNENELSICLLCLFIIMFIYIPANNQISTAPNTFITFFVLMIIWISKKLNIKLK